jgi:1,4-dihydroxy-2-naphthoate octaprenyltransferase
MNPVPEEFAGSSFSRGLKRAFHATRPKFFTASILPVIVGSAWGAHAGDSFSWYVFALALLATVCVHAASNVLNDVGDDRIGTDPRNEQRIYPYTGGSRFIQTGILSQSSMARLGITLIVIASIAGILLLIERGPMVIAFGIAGLLLGVLYSLGPVKLASVGLGEIAVTLAFGVIPVTGAAWLQGAPIDASLLLLSLPIGIWTLCASVWPQRPTCTSQSMSPRQPSSCCSPLRASCPCLPRWFPSACSRWHSRHSGAFASVWPIGQA